MDFVKRAFPHVLVVYKVSSCDQRYPQNAPCHEAKKELLESLREDQKTVELVRESFPEGVFVALNELSQDMLASVKLVVAVGGDEHFKSVVHACGFEKTFLNVCSNHLKSEGILSSCNRLNIDQAVQNIYSEKYRIEQWPVLSLARQSQVFYAFDTIFLGNATPPRMSHYLLEYKGIRERQKSSGYIIATGAGSTGWFRSAGGEAFSREERRAEFLVREIYRGAHSDGTLSRAEILEGDVLTLSCMSASNNILNCDCVHQQSLYFHDRVIIRLSEKTLHVLVPDMG